MSVQESWSVIKRWFWSGMRRRMRIQKNWCVDCNRENWTIGLSVSSKRKKKALWQWLKPQFSLPSCQKILKNHVSLLVVVDISHYQKPENRYWRFSQKKKKNIRLIRIFLKSIPLLLLFRIIIIIIPLLLLLIIILLPLLLLFIIIMIKLMDTDDNHDQYFFLFFNRKIFCNLSNA